LGDGRTHRLTPVLVFHVMPYSWQLSQAFARTTACFMMVPEKVVKLLVEWQLSQAIVPVVIWLDGKVLTAGVPANVSPAPWHVMQFVVKPA